MVCCWHIAWFCCAASCILVVLVCNSHPPFPFSLCLTNLVWHIEGGCCHLGQVYCNVIAFWDAWLLDRSLFLWCCVVGCPHLAANHKEISIKGINGRDVILGTYNEIEIEHERTKCYTFLIDQLIAQWVKLRIKFSRKNAHLFDYMCMEKWHVNLCSNAYLWSNWIEFFQKIIAHSECRYIDVRSRVLFVVGCKFKLKE